MLEQFGVNFDDPEVKSQIFALAPYFHFRPGGAEALAGAMRQKLTPELQAALRAFVKSAHGYLGELLAALGEEASQEWSEEL